MLTLTDIRHQLEDRQGRLIFRKIASSGIHLSPEGRLIAGDQTYLLEPAAKKDLARRARIPSDFFEALPPDLQAALFNRLYPTTLMHPTTPAELNVAIMDGRLAVSISDAALAVVRGVDVLEAVLEATPPDRGERESFEVAHFRLNGGISLSLVSPTISAEPRVGDIVRGGVDVHHSDTGAFGTQVSSYLFRLVCTNGQLLRVCEHDEDLRVRRGGPETADAVLRRVRDVTCLAWQDLQLKLAVLRDLTNEVVDDPAAVIDRILRDAGFYPSQKLIRELLAALNADELGNRGTLYDVMNAFSRVGTHAARRPFPWCRRFLFASGDILRERFERCPQCRSILQGQRA
jgi:hypothetical protein